MVLKRMAGKTGGIVAGCVVVLMALAGCGRGNDGAGARQAPSLPVMPVERTSTVVPREYSAILEGVVSVEIRPQTEGTLQEIAVDEGDYVRRGQLLFAIDERVYREELRSAEAQRNAARAALAVAEIEVEKLGPLVKNKVVSPIQMKEAVARRRSAKADVEQASAALEKARINLGYTRITAPVDGYIGDIPFRLGSLVSKNQSDALTTLTDVSRIRAYFSMSEVDFVKFKQRFTGASIEEKLASVPPVSLVLADGSRYVRQGRIDAVNGQFDRSTASVMFRATFPNDDGLLREGNTGKVLLSYRYDNVFRVPQSATMDLQDRVFVMKVAEDSTVARAPVSVLGKSGTDYLISDGLENGDRIVLSGMGRLQDGMRIAPRLPAEEHADDGGNGGKGAQGTTKE